MVESAKIFNPSYKPKKPKPEPVWKKDWLKNKANKEVLNAEYLRNYQALDKIATAPKYIGAEIMRSIALKALDRDLVCQ